MNGSSWGHKMTEPATLSISPKWLNDATTKMVGLFNTGTNTTAATAFSDSATGAAYQVPVGKVFYILNIFQMISDSSGGVATVNLYGSATSGGTDHIKAYMASSTVGSDGGNAPQNYPVFITIDAGDYITHVCSSTTGYNAQFIGVETDV